MKFIAEVKVDNYRTHNHKAKTYLQNLGVENE